MGRRVWVQHSIAAAGLLVSAYAVALLVTGALSRPHGDAKAFREIDCHVAYAVTGASDSSDNVVLTVEE